MTIAFLVVSLCGLYANYKLRKVIIQLRDELNDN